MNNIRLKSLLLLISGLVLLALSCKKKEVDIPNVQFILPKENKIVSVGDTIDIQVEIHSKSKLESVEFNVVDENLKPILPNYSYPVDGSNNMNIHYALRLTDYYMKGGRYQILCKVANKSEVKHKYRTLIVSAINKRLEDVAVVTKSALWVHVYSLGATLNHTALKYKYRGDYASSVYIPFYHRFAIAGSTQGNMIEWNYFSNDTLFVLKSLSNPPFPYFSVISSFNNYLAVGYYRDKINFYNYLNAQKMAVHIDNSFYPNRLIDLGNNFIIEQKQINGTNNLINLYLGHTASYRSSFSVHGSLVNAFPFEGNDFMIFYNANGQGHIEKFVFDDNATTDPINYHGAAFNSVTRYDSDNYFLSTATDLLWYQYSISSITSIYSGANLSCLKYDKVSGMLYAVEGKKVVAFSVPQGVKLAEVSVGEEILNLHLIYNK